MILPLQRHNFQLEEETSPYHTIAARGPMLDRVYSMRYRSYSEEGYIEKDPSCKFMDEYDSRANCTSYILYKESKAVASIRVCLYDPLEAMDVPVMSVYDEEIKASIGYNSRFIEINKFVVDPEFQRKGGLEARFQIFKLLADVVTDVQAKSLLVAVRPAHIKFYRMLKCRPVSEVKAYPYLNFKTILLASNESEILEAQEFIYSKLARRKVVNESVPYHRAN